MIKIDDKECLSVYRSDKRNIIVITTAEMNRIPEGQFLGKYPPVENTLYVKGLKPNLFGNVIDFISKAAEKRYFNGIQ